MTDPNYVNGATGSTLTLADTMAANAGAYTVIIGNAAGTLTSGVARLTFTELKTYAGLTILGVVGTNYRIDYTLDLSGTPVWTAQTNFALPSSPYLHIDQDSPGRPRRFYRAVPVE